MTRWRIYPESRRSLYADVFVWESRAAYNRHRVTLGKTQRRGTLGMCESGRKPERPRWFADIHLILKAADANTISHEVFHATVGLGWRWRALAALDHRGAEEERLAEAHGNMVQQIIDGFRRYVRARD